MRRERTLLDVYLVNGTRLRGRIRSFDQYSMIIETGQGDAFLYHHTVSSVGRAVTHQRPGLRRPAGGMGNRSRHEGFEAEDTGDDAPPGQGTLPQEDGFAERPRPADPDLREPAYRRPAPRTDGTDGPVVVRKISRRIVPGSDRS